MTGQRLYQLIRQDGTIADLAFEIRFLDPGVQGLFTHFRVNNGGIDVRISRAGYGRPVRPMRAYHRK